MRFLSCALLRNSVYIYRLALMAPTTNPFSERQNREEFDFRRGHRNSPFLAVVLLHILFIYCAADCRS